jgi:hypothetical protein
MVYGFVEVMCRRYFEDNPITLGGEGVVCQVDGGIFAFKPDGCVHCLFIIVHKKCKIVNVRYKIQVQCNLYIKSLNSM